MNGDGFGRMTMAHELGHMLSFKLFGIKLYRKTSFGNKIYEDPEWQAKCFAGELLMDYEMTTGMTINDISKKCGVSFDAAEYRVKKY